MQYRLWAQIDRRVEELFDEEAKRVGFNKRRDLIAKLKLVEHLLDVRREAVEVCFEVCLELLAAGTRGEVAKPKLRRVVEGFSGGLTKSGMLVGNAGLVQLPLHDQNRIFAWFQHRVQTANDGHREDHVTIFAANVDIPQNIVGDVPNEIADV